DMHYLLRRNWSAYVQYATGNNIPPSSVFDVKNAAVATLPKPTLTTSYQAGEMWKLDRLTLDVDVYHLRFENDYSSSPDPATGEPVYYLSGTSITKGVEVESTIRVAYGLALYLNGTYGSAKYSATHLSVQNAPRDN